LIFSVFVVLLSRFLVKLIEVEKLKIFYIYLLTEQSGGTGEEFAEKLLKGFKYVILNETLYYMFSI